ncbi:MAG: radical SAM protein [Magnetococcales bacterium]|nr:radical SAM protein [Magnetococcales bacterium]NGZ26488.1 radical SAM protein [Magnetococcales bacterium]
MNLLLATAPTVVFNPTLHYRYTDVGEVLGYLQRERPDWRFRFLDGLVVPVESAILREIVQGVDGLVLFSDVATAPATRRLATLANQLVADLPILVYGKGPLRIPAYFQRPPFTACHVDGDQEHAILSYFDALNGDGHPEGVVQVGGPPAYPGRRLGSALWGWADLEALPLESYRNLAILKKIPFELSIYPSKGCHRGCHYCDAPRHEGDVDRRRLPDALVAWTTEAVRRYRFDCVQLHSTDLAADPEWLKEFARAFVKAGSPFPWTCCVHGNTLTESHMDLMAASGCQRIGLGVESLIFQSNRGFKVSRRRLSQLASYARMRGLRLKGYIMAGLPGQTEYDLLDTYLFCLDQGIEPRVSTYTPFQELEGLDVSVLDQMDLERWDRKSFLVESQAMPVSTVIRMLVRPPDVEDWARERLAELTRRTG